MENQCPTCGSPMKWVPAGVSKNGRPYPGFMACPNRCPKNQYQQNNAYPANYQRTTQTATRPIYQDNKDVGIKLANAKNAAAGIIVALIEKGLEEKDIESTFKKYCDFVYNYVPGQAPSTQEAYNVSNPEEINLNEIPF